MRDRLSTGSLQPCRSCFYTRLARIHDLAGRPDSAIAAFEAYLTSKEWSRLHVTDPEYLAATRKRLAELYDARGDREKAASHYAAFIDRWKDTDSELQPAVRAARNRLLALTRTEPR